MSSSLIPMIETRAAQGERPRPRRLSPLAGLALAASLAPAACTADAGPPEPTVERTAQGMRPRPDVRDISGWLTPSADVLTQHNDNGRTGATAAESVLTPANVRPLTFGKLRTRSVRGHIYAQPLYAEHVRTGVNRRLRRAVYRDLVYVATMDNWVQAFDANDDTSAATTPPVWEKSFGTPGPQPLRNVDTTDGIMSTPVIDRATETMYLVARTADAPVPTYTLHAVDIGTGRIRRSQKIEASVDVSVAGTTKKMSFDANVQLQRPGLLLHRGAVYVAFGSQADWAGFHGWVISYDAASFKNNGAYVTTPHGVGGGIWQAGNGLAADGSGLYFMSGNAMYPRDAPTTKVRVDQEDSFVKVRSDLTLVDSWSPSGFSERANGDVDLGSGGVMLIPGTRKMIGGGKPGRLYLLDRTTLAPDQEFQAFTNTYRAWHAGDSRPACVNPDGSVAGADDCFTVDADYQRIMGFGPHIHGSPVFWRGPDRGFGRVYAWGEKDTLKAFKYHFATGRIDETPAAAGDVVAPKDSMPGGTFSVSSNMNRRGTGIVWATVQGNFAMSCPGVVQCNAEDYSVPGRVFAFDAETLEHLWGDEIAHFSKFTPPTVAAGKVFVATHSNELLIYGLKPFTRIDRPRNIDVRGVIAAPG